jgi:hypothetical protein
VACSEARCLAAAPRFRGETAQFGRVGALSEHDARLGHRIRPSNGARGLRRDRPDGRAAQPYLARRRAEGKTGKEAIRALKRHLIRTINQLLNDQANRGDQIIEISSAPNSPSDWIARLSEVLDLCPFSAPPPPPSESRNPEIPSIAGLSEMGGAGLEPATSCL